MPYVKYTCSKQSFADTGLSMTNSYKPTDKFPQGNPNVYMGQISYIHVQMSSVING